jgi:hypothetical protein
MSDHDPMFDAFKAGFIAAGNWTGPCVQDAESRIAEHEYIMWNMRRPVISQAEPVN